MSIDELYQDIIVEHSQHPRNFREDAAASHVQEKFNPLCGDRVKLYLRVEDGVVKSAAFQGAGCAISMASASLLSEAIKGKSVADSMKVLTQVRGQLLPNSGTTPPEGDLATLSGVKRFPVRIKCALLAWEALSDLLKQETARS